VGRQRQDEGPPETPAPVQALDDGVDGGAEGPFEARGGAAAGDEQQAAEGHRGFELRMAAEALRHPRPRGARLGVPAVDEEVQRRELGTRRQQGTVELEILADLVQELVKRVGVEQHRPHRFAQHERQLPFDGGRDLLQDPLPQPLLEERFEDPEDGYRRRGYLGRDLDHKR
jgi:hypothetical protein